MTSPFWTRAPWLALPAALALLALSGCAGTGTKPLSSTRLQAISLNQRGVEDSARGRRDDALVQFREALRLQSSIENTDGMIVALINIARTRRQQGEYPAALDSCERALALLVEPSGLAGELFFEKAKILQASGELASAGAWAERAVAAEKGGALGARLNLLAAINLRRGLYDEARGEAETALKLSREAGFPVEEANSQRILGETHLLQGRGEAAMASFGAALLLDKEAGLAGKIALDLRGLGGAAQKSGELDRAAGFYRRALEVSLSAGDLPRAAEDLQRLAELSRQKGDTALAEKLEAERKRLLKGKAD